MTKLRLKFEESYLRERYVDKKESTVVIAKDHGCDPSLIRRWLKKFSIQTRNLCESHLTGYEFAGNVNVLYGSLLGDASLIRRNHKTDMGSASFSKANVGYDHVLHVARAIYGEQAADRIVEQHPALSNRPVFKFTTPMCSRFLSEWRQWYKNGVKCIPDDLILNSKIVLHWFMDDGHCSWKRKNQSLTVGFATESFTTEDCEKLKCQLGTLDVNVDLQKSHGGFGWNLRVLKNSIENFFGLIGNCPADISSMQYKWKLDQLKTKIAGNINEL